MDVRRVHPEEDENDIAAEQVRDLLGRVPCRNAAAPLFVFDAGYDPVKLQRGLDELPLQLPVRLHSNRVFYDDPELRRRGLSGVPTATGRSSISTTPKPGPTLPTSITARPRISEANTTRASAPPSMASARTGSSLTTVAASPSTSSSWNAWTRRRCH